MAQDMKICMIGGSGRSGTTILKRILGCHPGLTDPPEFRFTVDPDGLVDFYQSISSSWSPYQFDLRLRRLKSLLRALERKSWAMSAVREAAHRVGAERWLPCTLWTRYPYYGLRKLAPDYRQLVNGLLDALTDFRFRGEWMGMGAMSPTAMAYAGPRPAAELAEILGSFYRAFARSVVEHQGATHFLEKNTWNGLYFDALRQLVPEARLVHIHRDPRDVVASLSTQSWAPAEPRKAAIMLRDFVGRWQSIRDGLSADSFLEVGLEDLIASPRPVLEGVCEFWGIDWDDALLSIPLSSGSVGRWRKQFSAEDARAVCRELQPVLDDYGYDDA